jgi:HTH-type transcriptional regulator/antitoxin HigA
MNAVKILEIMPDTTSNLALFNQLNVRFPLVSIKNKKHHMAAKDVLSKLMDIDDDQLAQKYLIELRDYKKTLILLIKQYESANVKTSSNTEPKDVLNFLMMQHGLTQDDFVKEIGRQPAVSKILNGKQELSLTQIYELANRFSIQPASFLGRI